MYPPQELKITRALAQQGCGPMMFTKSSPAKRKLITGSYYEDRLEYTSACVTRTSVLNYYGQSPVQGRKSQDNLLIESGSARILARVGFTLKIPAKSTSGIILPVIAFNLYYPEFLIRNLGCVPWGFLF